MDCLLSLLLPCQSLHPPSSQRRKSSCLSQPLSPTFFPPSVNWAPLSWIINDRTGKTSALLLPHRVGFLSISCRDQGGVNHRVSPLWLLRGNKNPDSRNDLTQMTSAPPLLPSLAAARWRPTACRLGSLLYHPLLPPPPPQTVMAHPPA